MCRDRIWILRRVPWRRWRASPVRSRQRARSTTGLIWASTISKYTFPASFAHNLMSHAQLYQWIEPDQAAAAIGAAHARGLHVTGHLCSLTWRDALAAGIDC